MKLGNSSYNDCVILSGNNVPPHYDIDIDLYWDFLLNTEAVIISVKEEIPVSSLEEVLKISEERGLDVDFDERKKAEGLYCGTKNEFLLEDNLCGVWI